MTNAVPILLADAITTVINAAVTAVQLDTVGFTARRSYPDWDDDFKDLKDLVVDVVPVSSASGGGVLIELDSAGSLESEPAVDIAVRKRFQPSDRDTPGAEKGQLKNSSVDPLVRLVEQIHELLAGDRMEALSLASGIDSNWLDTSVRTYCDYAKLRQGCFLGCVRVRYSVSKASV